MEKLILLGCFLMILLGSCQSENNENESLQDKEETEVVVEDTITKAISPIETFDSSQYVFKDGYIVLTWSALADIDFEDRYSEELGAKIPFPLFSERIKALEGKQVEIQGYVIPFEETGEDTYIILSAFPYTQCFFCGNAGPETVMDILPEEESVSKRLKMDQQTTFRGKLKLNDSDFYYLNYILEEAILAQNK